MSVLEPPLHCAPLVRAALAAVMLLGAAASCAAQGAPPRAPNALAPWEACWIWKPGARRMAATISGFEALSAPDDRATTLQLRKEFRLERAPARAAVRVSADSRYRLWINGAQVARGPAPSDPFHQSYDELDIAKHLVAGANVIAAEVHFYGEATGLWRRAAGDWFVGTAPGSPPTAAPGAGGLLLECRIDGGMVVGTDGSWRYREAQEWARPTPKINPALGFVEIYDARREAGPWKLAGFDDAGWERACVVTSSGKSRPPIDPYPTLEPRDIAPLVEQSLAPARIVGIGRVQESASGELWTALREEAGATEWEHNTPAAIAPMRVEPTAGRALTLLLDFGAVVVGHPWVELAEAAPGAVVDLAWSDHRWEEAAAVVPGIAPAGARGAALDFVRGKTVARYVAKAGAQRFELRDRCALRYLQITIRGSAPLQIGSVGMSHIRSASALRADLPAWTDWRGELLRRCVKTLEACAVDALVDGPTREARQYLGDVRSMARTAYALTGDDRLADRALRAFFRPSRRDGLPEISAPGDGDRLGVTIPDYALQGILALSERADRAGGEELVRELWPGVVRALDWFLARRRDDGLVGEVPGWVFLDWALVDRTAPSSVLNALFAWALERGAALGERVGDRTTAARFRAAREEVAARFESFFDPQRGAYTDALDAAGLPNGHISVHANALAILAALAPRERWGALVETLAPPAGAPAKAWDKWAYHRSEILSPPAFDVKSQIAGASPFFQMLVCDALRVAGAEDRALESIRHLYGPMLQSDDGTLWEHWEWSPGTTRCHGWSAWPAAFLLGGPR